MDLGAYVRLHHNRSMPKAYYEDVLQPTPDEGLGFKDGLNKSVLVVWLHRDSPQERLDPDPEAFLFRSLASCTSSGLAARFFRALPSASLASTLITLGR